MALSLADKIVAGTATNVPAWGYKLLSCAPEESVSKLSACLADTQLGVRERATVALGYLGSPALSAASHVSRAVEKAETKQERLLLEWCLREISN